MSSNASVRPWSTVVAIICVLAAAARVEAGQYKLSGSVDGTGTFLVDDNLDVYLNGSLYSTTNVPPGTPAVRSPITINANIGDTLRFDVRDTYGVCSKLSRLILTDAVGRFVIADPGFDRGCGFPPTNQGITHSLSFVIPVMPDLPPFDDTVLPGSTLTGPVPGPDGLLYGVTYDGGLFGKGTVYAFDPALSSVALIHSFDGVNDGSVPYEELALDPVTGRFYGTTRRGGLGNAGTVFEFDPATHGLITFNVDFAGYTAPQGPLVQSGGFLFGALRYPSGAVFRMATDGSGFTVIHAFSEFGANPNPITLGPDGLLYGTTTYGGGVVCNPTFSPVFGCGNVFRLKPVLPGDSDEQFQTLYTFQDTTNVNRNNYPQGQLIYGSDGLLYGTTYYKIFRLNPNDPNPTTTFQLVWSDGRGISLSAIEGADHRLYGADYNGPLNAGRIFVVDRDGANATDLHVFSFTEGSQSNGPFGRLFRNAVGTVYGTTEYTTLSSPHPGTIFAISGTGVNPPSPPVLGNVAVTATINENDFATLTGQISDPDPASTFTLTINWGDGGVAQTLSYPAGTTSFSQTHRYLDDNPTGTSSDVYPINLTLTNSHSASATATRSLTVNNVVPGALTLGTVTPSPILAGVPTTASFTLTDAGTLDTHTVVIGWGDGTANTTVPLAAGVLALNVTHTFTVSGTLTVSATVSDDDLGSSSTSIPITVNPLSPPVLSNIAAAGNFENLLATLSGQMSDADAASTFALTINWGDGSAPQTFNYPAGTASFSETHRYLDDNPTGTGLDVYTINLTITDSHGGSTTGSTTVTVFNSPPTLTNISVSPSQIIEGGSTTLTGTVGDLGTLDSHTVVIDWNDSTPLTTINLAAGVTTFSATHQYTYSLNAIIQLTLRDDDGGLVTGTANITITPPPPPPVLSNIAAAGNFENLLATLSGQMSDADAASTFALTINWGDGSAPQTFNYPAGTASFSLTHRYLDDNPTGTGLDVYTINLTLTDSHGGSTTGSTTVTVFNSPPTLTSISVSPSQIIEGGSTTLTGTVGDLGTLDSHIVVIDWNDGTPMTTNNLAAGVTTFSATHQYTSSLNAIIQLTLRDDDGGLVTGTANIIVNPLPPAAPSNLTAVAVSKNQINLTWTDNSNSESRFDVERCDGNGKCTVFALIGQTNSNVTVFADPGLAPGSNHVYRVRAANAGGTSAYTNTANAKTPRK